MQTSFPFTRVFVLGIILFFFGLASMIISVISFVTQSWGHYVGTGMWGGAMILVSGLAAVFASRLKTLVSVKIFCLCSTAAVITSFAMLILSAGGLTLSSGFYSRLDPPEYSKRTSNLIHASLLVISVFCLSGNVLAVIVCCKYLFCEYYKPKRHRRHRTPLRDGSARTTTLLRGGGPNIVSSRASTESRIPLQCTEHSHRRLSDHVDVNHVQMEYRRSHRRTASDQPHASHSRRHRQCVNHMEDGHGPSRLNVLSPDSVNMRCHADKRRMQSRTSGHQMVQDIRMNSKERERLNIEPLKSAPNTNRHIPNPLFQSCLPRNVSSSYPKVRLPTDFDEEELPPYEPKEAPQSVTRHNISTVDSGDESDTENSSSTEAHSYVADDCHGAAEAFPMVDLQNMSNHPQATAELRSNHEQITSFTSSPVSRHQNAAGFTSSCTQKPEMSSTAAEHPLPFPVTVSGGEVNLISVSAGENTSDSLRPNHCVLRFASHQDDPSGDYERLLTVSPEICAINGESPSPIQKEEHTPHKINENFYENGPCYENCQHVGRSLKLNQLSKSSTSSSPTQLKTLELQEDVANGVVSPCNNKSLQASCTVPVHVLTQSTEPGFVSSPHSLQSNFNSSFSAFKPVCATSLSSPQNTHVTTPLSPSAASVFISSTIGFTKNSNVSGHQSPTESSALLAQKYEQQGAKPKTLKQTIPTSPEFSSPCRDHMNMSWKNIPLPHSYNHTDCVTCEPEDKLPSKTIPFTDSLNNNSLSLSSHTCPVARSPSSNLAQSQPSPSEECTSPFGAVAQSILSSSIQSSKDNFQFGSAINSATTTPSKRHSLSFREVSTQANSPVSQIHTGARRSLSHLQHRREELTGLNLSKHSTADSTSRQTLGTQTGLKSGLAIGTVALRSTRLGARFPTTFSSASSGNKSVVPNPPTFASGGVSQRSTGPAGEGSPTSVSGASEVSFSSRQLSLLPLLRNQSSPTSVSSHLHSQTSNPLLRQNPLIQHYPLQPQQPRLGVQLHQRRQQQHQLQQNIESQQQQQRQHQQQQEQQQRQDQPQGPQQQQQEQRQEHQRQEEHLEQHQQQYQQHGAGQAVNIQNPNDRQQLRNGRPLFSVLL